MTKFIKKMYMLNKLMVKVDGSQPIAVSESMYELLLDDRMSRSFDYLDGFLIVKI